MNYLKQISVIGLTLFIGLALKRVLPLPIPEVIYAMIVFFIFLHKGLIKVEDYEELAKGVLSLMALYFVAPATGLMESYKLIIDDLLSVSLIIVASTLITFTVTGLVAKSLSKEETDDI